VVVPLRVWKVPFWSAVCGMPPEYCEYGPDFARCKVWHRENLTAEAGEGASGSGEGAEEAAPVAAPKSKGKPAAEPKVIIQSKDAAKRGKHITIVAGLDSFGVKLKDAKRDLASRFAASASITENAKGTKMLQVGGEVDAQAAQYVIEEYGIDVSKVFVVRGGKAIPAAIAMKE
jgi:density-regulated protein